MDPRVAAEALLIGHAAWRKPAMNSQETCLAVLGVVQLEYAASP